MSEQWQSIESAPKDGKPILVCFKGQFCWVFFVADANGADTNRAGFAKPTHYMPLPAPPDASGLIDGLLIAAAEDALAALEQAGGAALGIAMSSEHPNPDEVLTNVFHSCNKAAKELRDALRSRAADTSASRSDRGGA